jgi:hypothetical protein
MYKVILKATRKNKDSPFWFFSPAGQAHLAIVEAVLLQNQHLIESSYRGYLDDTELQFNVGYISPKKEDWDVFQNEMLAASPSVLAERDQYFIDNKHSLTIVIVPESGPSIIVPRVPEAS